MNYLLEFLVSCIIVLFIHFERQSSREKHFLSAASLPEWVQWSNAGSMDLSLMSHVGAGAQDFGHSYLLCQAHQQLAELEVEQWDLNM